MQRKHIAIAAALSSLLAVGASQAQTVIVPVEPATTVAPSGADTILIVTPSDNSGTAMRDDSMPLSRAEVKADARQATKDGGTPRGEQIYADQERHMQSLSDPHAAAGNEKSGTRY